jgi:uncharacterized protein (TIGR02246 family)
MNNKVDIASIKRMYKDWKKPWEAGDAATVASFYTTDAIQMPVGEPDIVGKKAWEKSLKSLFKTFKIKGDYTKIKEVKIDNSLGFARGTYKLTLSPKKGGKSKSYTGKFLHIYERQRDGSWKIYRAIGGDD